MEKRVSHALCLVFNKWSYISCVCKDFDVNDMFDFHVNYTFNDNKGDVVYTRSQKEDRCTQEQRRNDNMFHEYKKPRTYQLQDLNSRFKHGVILLGRLIVDKTEKQAEFVVYGTLPYGKDDEISSAAMSIATHNPEVFPGGIPVKAMEIVPSLKTMLVADGRFSEQANVFWSDRRDFIKEQYDRMKEVYGTSENQMLLFYTVNKEKREIWYHGYSIEGYPVSRVAEKVGKQVFACTYEHFLGVKNSFAQAQTGHKNDSLEDIISEIAREENESSEDAMGTAGKTSVVRMQIQNFLDAHSFEEMLHFMKERVVGQPELPKVVAGVYHYLECVAQGKICKSNILLTAPSGCGKTETFRALRDYMNQRIKGFPVTQVDMTSITEEGFKGKDTNDIVREVYEQGDKSGIGIVFMDEFDKKLVPSYTSGGNDVNAAVQAQILTLIEGRRVEFKEGSLDTSNTLFIGLGSFDECRKRRETKKGGLGFGASANAAQSDHYHAISRDEMIGLGASYELLGRFQILANYYRLSEEAVEGLIQRFVGKTSESIGVTMKVTPEMKKELHALANGQYGCRMLENTITDRAMEMLPELLMKKEGKRYYNMILDSDGKSRIETRRIREEER